ncbi:hypothetical protein [Agrobacterium tumefaciens]|uniref:hypothetical protein n=1 Tax=Agrobacterium tumefaciens TaxID=358 RepID=UPI0002DA1BA1|nr:hypothetical protein [Agrobacterium tumefaciens]
MFSDNAVTFIRAISGKRAALRALLKADVMLKCADVARETCGVDSDLICLKETKGNGSSSCRMKPNAALRH